MAESKNPGLHRFAVLTACATLVLIFAGGLVKSTGSELAVPDWPLAFGKLIPQLKGGVLFEWSHRAAAGTVSILTLALMVWAIVAERRRWVRALAIVAFALIIVQAVLGGMTVLFLIPLTLAMAHTATANAFFCVIVALAVFTSPWFIDAAPRTERAARVPLAALCAITTGVIYVQILIGALMRHLSAGLAIPDFPLNFGHLIPPLWDPYIAINFTHRCGAIVVTCFIAWTAARVLGGHRDEAKLRRPAEALIVLLALQVSLGAITIWSSRAVLPTTSHVAVGAAILVTSLMLTIRAWRLYGVRASHTAPAPVRANDHVVDLERVTA